MHHSYFDTDLSCSRIFVAKEEKRERTKKIIDVPAALCHAFCRIKVREGCQRNYFERELDKDIILNM